MSDVIKSAAKWYFLYALELDGSNQNHQALYWLMKSEAIHVYSQQLDGNRSALKPEYARVSGPFAANHFTDAAWAAAIRTVEESASPQTLSLYRRGRMSNGSNWVIRWMLYHVCRYRDGRNKQKAQSHRFHDDDDLDKNGSGATSSTSSGGNFYDTARNEIRSVRAPR
ncbi:hypothetical protein ACLMJK_005557 [Lecanora helva]